MLNPKYKNRDSQLETSGKIVAFYEREFYCFSNFSSFAVKWKGKIWQTSEHAYQAAHFLKTAPKIAEKIYKAKSADVAKRITRININKVPQNWNDKKIGVMEDILRCKLKQNPYVVYKLKQSGKRKIVEDSPFDNFWGWGKDKKGRNELGRLWMKLRKEIIK